MSSTFLNYTEVFNCTEYPQIYQVNHSGLYFFEVYGAQGGGRQISGNGNSGYGGKGGYSSGMAILDKDTTLYVYVGCVGGYSIGGVAKGGYNGGGYTCSNYYNDPAHGGGGASDVRLIGGSWDNSNGLLSRFIVAGGGGGGGEDSDLGGYGGGVSGGLNPYNQVGTGGVFGKGAHSVYEGGGGGGGWIGGNTNGGSQTIPTSCSTADETNGGAGGSGYVYTNTSEVYNGYLVPKKYQMIGAALTPNVNEGNGSVKITLLSKIILNEKCECTHNNQASLIASFILISLTAKFKLKKKHNSTDSKFNN
jgi:hypothetical protein